MSIMPQGGPSAYIDPANTTSPVAPVLEIRTPQASRRIAEILADGPSAEEAAEARLADIVELLVLAVAVGASRIDLGTVSTEGAEIIATALEAETVTYLGDIATITSRTSEGELAVTVRVEPVGQVAA